MRHLSDIVYNEGDAMSFDEKVDVIDLIINVLKDHEKTLDELIFKLEEALGNKEAELVEANATIAGMEQAAAESAQSLGRLDDSLKQAVSSYKDVVVQSNPGIIEELINGESIEEINASLEKAKSLVSQVSVTGE